MAHEEGQTREPTTSRHVGRKRLRCAAVALIIALILFGLSWISGLWESQSAEEELAAIEAERAIPDEENAALIYSRLVDDYDEESLWRGILNRETDGLTPSEPRLSKDYPELARWLEEHQGTISKLLEASKMEKCRFPITIEASAMRDRMLLLGTMKRWARFLARAANNDMAEGRVNPGLEKYLCLVQMGKHLRQQPVLVEYLVGMAIEALGLTAVARFTVEGDATEAHLKMIEAALPQTKDNWSEDSPILRETERLLSKQQHGPFKRLILFWRYRQYSEKEVFDRIREIYLRSLVTRRGHRILFALRRYKTKTGKWPESLDEIESSLSGEILTDPFNSDSFVYRLTGDGFKLYSRGENNIDEDGKYGPWSDKNRTDDWIVWPPKGRKTEQKRANAK